MSRFHLLWWVFTYLRREHPDALLKMESAMEGDEAHPWVRAALRERLEAWRKSQ